MAPIVRLLHDLLTWKAPPTLGATCIGVFLGMGFATLSGEAIDPAAPASASTVFLIVMTVSWGAIGGLAFSRRLGFPPPHPIAADWVWQGGLRGTAAALCSLVVWFLSWMLLDLGGPKRRLGGDPWQWGGIAWGYALIGFFTGALFAGAIWWRSSNTRRSDGSAAPP